MHTTGNTARYFRKLLGYVLLERRLLTASILYGVLGLCLPFAYPQIIGAAIDHVIAPPFAGGAGPNMDERTRWLVWLTTAAAATAVAFGVVGYAKGHFTLQLGNRVVTRLRADLFEHFQKLSLQFYAKERTGGIVWRIAHEVNGVNNILYAGILLLAFDAVQLIIAIALMFSISWQLACAVLSIVPLYLLVFLRYSPHVQTASEAVSRHISVISGTVHEQVSAAALVKTYTAERHEAARFSRANENHHDFVDRQSHLGHLMGATSEFFIHAGTTIIVGYGCYLALFDTQPLSAGDLTRFLGYTGILYGPLKRFADLNLVYQNSLASVRRVFRVFDIEPAIAEPPAAHATPPTRGAIRYENVRFHYAAESPESRIRLDEDEPHDSPFRVAAGEVAPEPAPWILDGVDCHIRPGERIAIVGPSGSGKTSMVSLLPRLYEFQHGRIEIDGIDIRTYSLKALRSAIAVVQQDSFLFSGTIRDNLAYGNPAAGLDEIVAAARAANAHDFIAALPDGYDSELGERGINLSGAQRQRLSIARALLRNPRILILDEATSALDTESERHVQSALEHLMQGRTCLIVAHRLSTVRNADRIVVLSGGRIVECGTHDALWAHQGLYARLVRQQFGGIARERVS